MRLNNLIWGTASAMVLAVVASGGAAFAQEEESAAVSEIIVTAQKREQRLQDIPVTVTVASKQLLDDAGVNDIRDLQILTPGLTVTSTTNSGSTTARIRGIGTVGDNPGLESSVGVTIDGVYRPRNGVGFGDLGQVSRIEVLKGPQGTLYGKNNSAGVINVISVAPSYTFGGEAEATATDFSGRGGSLYVTGPLVGEVVAGSLFAAIRNRDGLVTVVPGTAPGSATRSTSGNDEDYYTVRGQLRLDPNDTFRGRIIVDYTERREDCCLATQLFVGQQAGSGVVTLENPLRARSRGLIINDQRPGAIDITNTPYDRIAYSNRASNQNIEDMGVSAQFDADLSDTLTLTSISALRLWKNVFSMDADFTGSDLLYRPDDGSNFNKFEQISQEFRLAGTGERLNWVTGVFLQSEDLDSRQVLLTGADFYNFLITRALSSLPALTAGITPAGGFAQLDTGTRDSHLQRSRSAALFGNVDYEIIDDVTLTLGLRYTRDEKKVQSNYRTTGATCGQAQATYPTLRGTIVGLGLTAPVGAIQTLVADTIVSSLCSNQFNAAFDGLGVLRQEMNEDNVSGTAKVAWRVNDNIMTYASYSRGYKAGGFNLDRAPLVTGTASTTASRVYGANPNTAFAEETVDSYELGAKFEFGRDLLLNVAAFDQTFENFQLNTFMGTSFIVTSIPEVVTRGVDFDLYYTTPITGLSLQGGVTYADTTISPFTPPSGAPSVNRLSGGQLSFSPEWSATLAATYVLSVSDNWEVRSNLSGKYTTDYNTGSDLNPAKQQDNLLLLNGRVSLTTKDDKLAIELFAQNLTDEEYLQVGFNGPYQVSDSELFTNQQNDDVSVYNAFLGAPRIVGVTLRSKF